MGGSYGGFMTFWTITQTNRFKAAIGHAGISDWYRFYGQSDIPGLMATASRRAVEGDGHATCANIRRSHTWIG